MPHVPHTRRLLGALLVAMVAAVVPAAAADAAPSPAPAHEQTARPTKHDRADKNKHKPAKAKHDKHDSTSSPAPAPSATPSAAPEPAVLGPTAPAHPSPPALRVLSGQTLGALSYDDARPLPHGTPARRVPAVQGPPLAVTWPPHDRPEWPTVAGSVRSVVDHPTAPLLVGGLIGLFLLVQNRLDRHDPKLTRDPGGYPPDLRFGPAVRSNGPVR